MKKKELTEALSLLEQEKIKTQRQIDDIETEILEIQKQIDKQNNTKKLLVLGFFFLLGLILICFLM